jgi:DNA-damage-inducible protein D
MKIDLSIELFQKLEHVRYLNRELDCWSARGLQKILSYTEWRSFRKVIEKAMITCGNAGYPLRNHFVKYRKMIRIGNGGRRKLDDVGLSRYACYLITGNTNLVQNRIAYIQAYFSTQNRNREIIEHRLLDLYECNVHTKSENKVFNITYDQGTDQEGFRLLHSVRDRELSSTYSMEEIKKKWEVALGILLAGFRVSQTTTEKAPPPSREK